MVYIGFFENGRFVNNDKIRKETENVREELDRNKVSILNK